MGSYRRMRKMESRYKPQKHKLIQVTLACGCKTTVDMPAEGDAQKYREYFLNGFCREHQPNK